MVTPLLLGRAGLSLASALESGRAAKERGGAVSRALRQKARLFRVAIRDAEERAKQQAGAVQRAGATLTGAQRAALAAQGIDVASGSALAVQQETAQLTAEDVQEIRNNAWREAWGFRLQESDLLAQARQARIAGRAQAGQALTTGGVQAASDVMLALTVMQQEEPTLEKKVEPPAAPTGLPPASKAAPAAPTRLPPLTQAAAAPAFQPWKLPARRALTPVPEIRTRTREARAAGIRDPVAATLAQVLPQMLAEQARASAMPEPQPAVVPLRGLDIKMVPPTIGRAAPWTRPPVEEEDPLRLSKRLSEEDRRRLREAFIPE